MLTKYTKKINTYYVFLGVLLVASTIFIVVTLNGIFTGIRTASDLTLNGSDSLPISTTTIDRQQLTKAFATAFVRPYTAIELK